MKETLEVGQSIINCSVLLKNQAAGRGLRKKVQNNNISKVRKKLADGVTSVSLEEQCCCIEIAINNQNIDMLKVLLKMLGPNLNGSAYIVTIINKALITKNPDITKTTLDYLAIYLDNQESAQVLRSAVAKGNVEIIKNVLENLGTYISKENYQKLLNTNFYSSSFNKTKIQSILKKFHNETKYYSIIPFNNNSSNKTSTNYHHLIETTQSKGLRTKVLKGNIAGVKKIIDDGVTTIDYASLIIAVRIAIHNSNQKILSILINIPGSPIKEQDLGYLLKETVLNNNPEIVQTLLTLSPQVTSKYAEESLLLAVTKNNVEVVNNIFKDLGSKISIDCLKSAVQIAKSPDIQGLLQSKILIYDEAPPKSLVVTKSNAQNQRTNLVRSKSIDGSPDHNIPSTENNQRNDFKTDNHEDNSTDELERSNIDNTKDVDGDSQATLSEESSEEQSNVASEAPSDEDSRIKSPTSKDNISRTSLTEDLPKDLDRSSRERSLAESDDGTLVIMILQHLVELYNKGNLEGNNYIAPQETPSTDSNDDTHITQDTIKIGKEIIDLQSDRVPTRDIILASQDMHYLKTKIYTLELDVKKINEDLKKYIPNVITNHAVRAFSSNNDNQIFPKGNDDIIVKNCNSSNKIEELFLEA